MLFWVIAGLLALVIGALLLLALMRRAGARAAGQSDIQVYRDQLAEIDRDLARGVLAEDEAERSRIEVSRRLLEADKKNAHADIAGDAPQGATVLAAVTVTLVLLGGAFGLYAWIGAPGYGDLPLSLRISEAEKARAERPSQAEMEERLGISFTPPPNADPKFLELMEQLRQAVKDNPEELQGQMLLARNESLIGNFAAAHPAMARVIALKGDAAVAEDYSTYADLLVLAANGFVSPEAEGALQKALELEPRNGPARYYSGLMYAQSGRPDLAFRIWRPLLAESLPNAPWVPPIRAQIEEVAQAAGIRYTPPAASPAPFAPGRGPSAEDVEAASDMTPEERQEMIRGMVDGLAERLADEGGPPEDWARLINALGVLGDRDRAAAIWTEAQTSFADNPQGLATIRAAAQRAGVAQ